MTSILPLMVKDATVRRRGKTLVGPIEMELAGPGFSMVMGPNGAGKTTLLRMLHGLARLGSGSVNWNCPTGEARQRQAFVFQSPIVLRRSVRDNIAYPLLIKGVEKSDAYVTADTWMDRVGLTGTLPRQAANLSGGEKQKLALARALITKPELLFLDEPTANLDGRSMREIETILLDAQNTGTRIVMATHNIGQARRLATEVIFLYRGKVHERNQAAVFFERQATAEAAAFINGDILE